ncbi:MAG: hypothetical protein U1E19_08495 [Rhodoblastus sp.]
MHAGPIALAFAAIYLGAALYSVLVEQPARLTLDDRALVKEWDAQRPARAAHAGDSRLPPPSRRWSNTALAAMRSG